jgi:hypothetical protein
MGPFIFAEVPGGLRLQAAGNVLRDGADPVDAAVTLTWGAGNCSKVAVVNNEVKGKEAVSMGAAAAGFAEAEGCSAFLLEPALGATVPSAIKQTGDAPEIRADSVGEGGFSCLQLLGPFGWLGQAMVAVVLVGFVFSLFAFSMWAGDGMFVDEPLMAGAGGTEGACCSCAPETLGGCAWPGVLISGWE